MQFWHQSGHECVGIGDNAYTTEGITKIKITLAGYLVYFDIWIGDLSGQNAILGMDFMVPAGVGIDLADGSMRLPDEVGIPLKGRKRLYGEKVRSVVLGQSLRIRAGRSEETATRIKLTATKKLWIRTMGTDSDVRPRSDPLSGDLEHRRKAPTARPSYGRRRHTGSGQCTPITSVRFRQVTSLQGMAESGTRIDDTRSEPPEPIERMAEAAVQRPSYPTPRSILRRTGSADIDRDRTLIATLEYRPRAEIATTVQIEAGFPDLDRGHTSTPPENPNPKTENRTQIQLDQAQIKPDPGEEHDGKFPISPTKGVGQRYPLAEGATATSPQDAEDDEEIYYHDSGDLSAEGLEGNLAVLPEIPISTTAKVSIEELKVGHSGSATPEETEKLRQVVWKKRHLLIGKGNALPSAAKGVVCDIDVGEAKPIALGARKVPTRFREKVAGLMKGLLAAEII
ncbi:LOW QUALITY PROTEIN: hypothetical protein PHMEG_00013526 [Phytophthora megakarya]|uniref:Eukaryotic/viral aspartic protease n=1 Tax=Phytophthora megakarya TaxID=4795 RepID=A0A225W650_9STRA|nr:LOW QUALITY PROTEIN: hypothetical protein PHMEG_00013526 [Phytophthora megakarya]